ncbi:MAG: hypothetical protein QNJ33_15455 [Crocosphaera sp.]|nr:hypothetical protein [Crocosphaera sp.]
MSIPSPSCLNRSILLIERYWYPSPTTPKSIAIMEQAITEKLETKKLEE